MRDSTAQLSVDFLFGMLILLGVFAFTIQFATGSIIPLATTSEDASLVANRVSEQLVSDQEWFGTGQRGEVDLSSSNIDDLENIVDDSEELNSRLGIPEKYRLNVTAEYGGTRENIGRSTSGTTASVSSVKRVGYDVNSGEVASVKVRVW